MAAVRLGVAAILAGAGTLASALSGPQPHAATSPFGGPAAIRIAHVGAIDVDLEHGGAAGLVRTSCIGAAATTECYVALRR